MTDDFPTPGLVEELIEFMGSTKTSEALSPRLAKELYVDRMIDSEESLEERIEVELRAGRSVVVSGSAGGGKTMLVDAVLDRLSSSSIPFTIADEPGTLLTRGQITVVPDLTAIDGNRQQFLAEILSSSPLLLAANEGLLHDRLLPDELQGVLATLKDLLRGQNDLGDHDPVVIDLAGFAPLQQALEKLLAHPLIHEAVRQSETECDEPSLCPRLQALEQLNNVGVTKCIAELVSVTLQSEEVLYRSVWDLITDLFFRGSCLTEIPTSTWFWRLFFGETLIASRLSTILMPAFIPMASISEDLYEGNWQEVESSLELGSLFVLPQKPPRDLVDEESRLQLMRWLRLQYLILAKSADEQIASEFLGENSMSLDSVVRKAKSSLPLVRALNSYFMRHKQGAGDSPELKLWVEFSVERQTLRSSSLVSLGSITANNLLIGTSRCIAGLQGVNPEGSRLFLKGSHGEVLQINSSMLQALMKGRPVATQDRSSDDADNAIRRFYLELSASSDIVQEDRMDLMDIPEADALQVSGWLIGSTPGRLKQLP